MKKTKVIRLSTPIEDNAQKIIYEEIHLREPCLIEVEQFYDAQAKNSNSSLPAMRLLIALVSGATETALKRMSITDFNQCREFLMVFLSGNLDSNIGDN
ncbi:phage tail assembly protein [Xenorhabdus bovienii]|uniref:phage tail assembly protein n=1 Tax=Xenorhabdus bovienii TaxID=40576 RepID=UPI0023B025D0|nr:phage tail assembly protein [Xenorhabdus bovienii]MDE9477022.1 phage tail assembly protein [Xenorhabdus bovienii]MDE9530002.1 phage tail assembly protein [Xenorhabdus bovienii]